MKPIDLKIAWRSVQSYFQDDFQWRRCRHPGYWRFGVGWELIGVCDFREVDIFWTDCHVSWHFAIWSWSATFRVTKLKEEHELTNGR